jgi:NAD-dependent DNA ligase
MSALDPLEIQVLAHRYLYYVLTRPVLSDYDYDLLERRAKRALPETSSVHSVGSERPEDYPKAAVEYAIGLLHT